MVNLPKSHLFMVGFGGLIVGSLACCLAAQSGSDLCAIEPKDRVLRKISRLPIRSGVDI